METESASRTAETTAQPSSGRLDREALPDATAKDVNRSTSRLTSGCCVDNANLPLDVLQTLDVTAAAGARLLARACQACLVSPNPGMIHWHFLPAASSHGSMVAPTYLPSLQINTKRRRRWGTTGTVKKY